MNEKCVILKNLNKISILILNICQFLQYHQNLFEFNKNKYSK